MSDVKETGDRLTYLVKSESGPKWYRCDLLAMSGYGQCQCRDWEMRRSAGVARKLAMGTAATACKHLLKARLYFLNGLLVRMAKEEQGR